VWTLEDPNIVGAAVWGSGPNDVYVAGEVGQLRHFDGTQWSDESTGTGAHLTGVWGSGPTDVYVSTYSNALLHSEDGGWAHTVFQSGWQFSDIRGWGTTDVYAVPNGGLLRRDAGGTWGSQAEAIGGTYGVDKLWVLGPSDVWAVSVYDGITHYTGPGQSTLDHPPEDGGYPSFQYELQGIWASSDTDVYVVGVNAILHSTGVGQWNNQFPTGALVDGSNEWVLAVWGLNPHALYAFSDVGALYRSSGDGTWTRQIVAQVPSYTRIGNGHCAIWGTSETNLYVTTSNGTYHGVP
jgi:hypothetical protein